MNNEKEKSIDDMLFGKNKKIVIPILVLSLIFIFSFRAFVIERIVVSGESMMPNFQNDNVVFIKKFSNTYERNDVVVIRVNGKNVIKRIIGMPNETIQIKDDGYVYIDGNKLENDYGYATNYKGCAEQKITIGEDEYFVMGDNRDNSSDSRDWNTIAESQIKGEVFLRIFPYWEIEIYQ